jgi:hypothetical protein
MKEEKMDYRLTLATMNKNSALGGTSPAIFRGGLSLSHRNSTFWIGSQMILKTNSQALCCNHTAINNTFYIGIG